MSDYQCSLPLFDRPEQRPVPVNTTVIEEDIPRLNRQHHEILERLEEGPATNTELSAIAMRFGGRLHELQRAGYPFGKVRFAGGLYVYFLIGVHSSDVAEQYGRAWIATQER